MASALPAAGLLTGSSRRASAIVNSATGQTRALGLDALRGLAILAMLLSGQLPFGEQALPAWMYHAQVPPPHFEFNPNLPGITWVDLVFPFFLFAMGAAFPLAVSRRLKAQTSKRKLYGFVAERALLLGGFALFVQLIRPFTLKAHPTTGTWWLALLGFFILFLVLTRLPATWPLWGRWLLRSAGWLAAVLFSLLVSYPDGSGFEITRSDIIIIVLANMAFFGSLAWLLTREQLLLRLGLLGLLLAVRLSNLPQPTEGWVHTLWLFPDGDGAIAHFVHAFYRLYYLQYLCIVIPGTIAGDLILQWSHRDSSAATPGSVPGWSAWRYAAILGVQVALVCVTLVGLKARWLLTTNLLVFGLCLGGWRLLRHPPDHTGHLFQKLFSWAIYWLVLGLVFEPWEGGIKKDHPTLSYYFVTSGLALGTLIAFMVLLDVWGHRRGLGLLIDNGQNPMIAYAGINNFITPVLALTGGAALLQRWATTPWRGFCKGLLITLLMAWVVSFLTRRRVFWRT